VATAYAQACRPLPCYGTTHADHFYGTVPVTRDMTPAEIEADYELNTGRVIVETFAALQPLQIPAVLVAHHGPFTWGDSPEAAAKNSVVLEAVAQMALHTSALAPDTPPVPQPLLDKHFLRKHGPGAYYGQGTPS
jgi:L-ribulose-5-phosphate 4-epimerase